MLTRRWILFVILLITSCAVTLCPAIYFLANDPKFFGRGPSYYGGRIMGGGFVVMLSLLEPLLDWGLLRRRSWALGVGLCYFGVKAINAAGMTIGQALGGQKGALYLWVGGSLAVLWGGIAIFLLLNRDWFDQ
jgi:hypothetical protein